MSAVDHWHGAFYNATDLHCCLRFGHNKEQNCCSHNHGTDSGEADDECYQCSTGHCGSRLPYPFSAPAAGDHNCVWRWERTDRVAISANSTGLCSKVSREHVW